MGDHVGPVGEQSLRDGEANAGPATHAGDHDGPPEPTSPPRLLHLLEDLMDHRVVVAGRGAHLAEQALDHVIGPFVGLEE